MHISMNMPLSGLIDKSLRGEDGVMSEKWLFSYVENYADGDRGKLQQALNDVDKAISKWRENYFISTYDEKVAAVRQGKSNITSCELEDVYNKENYLLKQGKNGLTAESLYGLIEEYGFINEHHREAVESARLYNDMEFLMAQWEYPVLAQIRLLRGVIREVLSTVPTPMGKGQQESNRPLKRIEDYPEVFGMDICCELTGYAKDTIYKWTRSCEIPCHRSGSKGRKLQFKREEILKWMTARKQETQEEFIKRMDAELSSSKATLYNNPKKFKKHD